MNKISCNPSKLLYFIVFLNKDNEHRKIKDTTQLTVERNEVNADMRSATPVTWWGLLIGSRQRSHEKLHATFHGPFCLESFRHLEKQQIWSNWFPASHVMKLAEYQVIYSQFIYIYFNVWYVNCTEALCELVFHQLSCQYCNWKVCLHILPKRHIHNYAVYFTESACIKAYKVEKKT